MIEAAGVTLREAIEAILVIIIMATYVERTGESFKKKFIYRGAWLAVGLSITLAVVLSTVGINPENEFVEGILFFGAAILVGGLVIWMWRHAKHMKREIEQKMAKVQSGLALGFIAFLMVIREGVETVIFMQSLLLAGSSPIENFAGGLFGLILAILFGTVFMKGSSRFNLSLFFKVTSIILSILVIKLLANGFHEFFELGLLPSTTEIMLVVGFLAKSSTGAAIIALMLAFIMVMVIHDVIKSPQPDYESLTAAERRKARYLVAKERYSKIGLSMLMMTMVILLVTPTLVAADLATPEPIPVKAKNGIIRIEVPTEDGFYKYQNGNARIILAVENGEPFVALDGCYICPPKGYGFNGDVLICLNCDAPIEIQTIGNKGGCNPYVIAYRHKNGQVILNSRKIQDIWRSLE